jgi:hypothetical protein
MAMNAMYAKYLQQAGELTEVEYELIALFSTTTPAQRLVVLKFLQALRDDPPSCAPNVVPLRQR